MPLLEESVKEDLQVILHEELEAIDNSSGNTKAHVVNPYGNEDIWEPGMSMTDLVALARLMGAELTALCGYIWVPSKNPDDFPACEKCIRIAGELMANGA